MTIVNRLLSFNFRRRPYRPILIDVRSKHRLFSSSSSTISIDLPGTSSSSSNNLRFETGRLARFADGCAVCSQGDTSVMVTAVSRQRASTAYGGFVPLMVDYRQKAASAGRIPSNFLRRELGPRDEEVLTSRMIDRSVRVLFPKGYCYDTQLICNVLATDAAHDPDVLAVNAASMALALSDIPWNGPIGAVRLGLIDGGDGEENGGVVINPTRKQLQRSRLNMVLTGASNRRIVMLEMSGRSVPNAEVMEAIRRGLDATESIIESIESLRASNHESSSTKPKRTVTTPPIDQALVDSMTLMSEMRLRSIFEDSTHDKISRDRAVTELKQTIFAELKTSFPDKEPGVFEETFSNIFHALFRRTIFERRRRCDGRQLTELRPIACQTDLYAPLHGSALFQRGQTQVLCTVSFDSLDSAFRTDAIGVLMGGAKEKQFLLHYEFPPYATNEIGTLGARAAGRRELGHGALAEKALRSVVGPSVKNFPFTIRLTSEVLESNGSSSMATVCGGSLALMDAGVPIAEPMSGVAIGLVTRRSKEEDEDKTKVPQEYLLLTDILGLEDYAGDMDFKIAGTRSGVTAMQLDLKIAGISERIVEESIERAADANGRILDIMDECIRRPRSSMKSNRPVVETLTVAPNKRPRLVGIGGINLRRLESEFGLRITQLDDTTYSIFAPTHDAWLEAKERIEELLKADEDFKESQLEFGGIYEAKIVELRDSGVMVQLYPEMTPVMIPNSQLDMRKVKHPSALGLATGQKVMVKYFGRDTASGQMRLSKKILQRVGVGESSESKKDLFDGKKNVWTKKS